MDEQVQKIDTKRRGWIGVDLDGTLAHYDHWRGSHHIGEPIMPMVERVKEWLADGIEVRIFTARVSDGRQADATIIQDWAQKHIGVRLPVTNVKDFAMLELYDDRCVQVLKNEGVLLNAGQFWDTMRAIAVDGLGLTDPWDVDKPVPLPEDWAAFPTMSANVAAVRRERDELRDLVVEIGNIAGAQLTNKVSHEFLKLVKDQVAGRIGYLQNLVKELEAESNIYNKAKPSL